jgi:hypothetical protein
MSGTLPPLPVSTADPPDALWTSPSSSSWLSSERCLVCYLPPGLSRFSSPKQRHLSDGGGGGGKDYALFEEGTFGFPGKGYEGVEDLSMHTECLMYNSVCNSDTKGAKKMVDKLRKRADSTSYHQNSSRPVQCEGCGKGSPGPTIKCARKGCKRWYHWPCVRWLASLPEGAKAFVDPDKCDVMCAPCKVGFYDTS